MIHRSLKGLLGAVATISIAGGAAAQTYTLATDRAGTTYNAVGSGMAQVITDNSSARVIVRPFAGPDAYLDQLNNGELHFATQSSSSAYFAYQGLGESKRSYRNIRLIRAGEGGLFVGFVVYKDSDIHSISDLRGKRVTSEFGGHTVIQPSVTAALATAGLSWDDVQPVPVAGALAGPSALDGGRVDASWSSLGMPVTRELHAKRGVRFIDIPNTPENLATLRKMVFPGVNLTKVAANPDIGVPKDLHMINYDAYLIGNKDLSDSAVRTALQALWENTDKLVKIHRGLAGFKREAAVTSNPMIPYHPAAIEFYKEKGLWTDDVEDAHAKLLN